MIKNENKIKNYSTNLNDYSFIKIHEVINKEKLILKVFSIIDKLTITECEACINFYAGCHECLLDWVYQVDKYFNVAYRNLLSTDRCFRQIYEAMSNCFEADLKSIILRMLLDLDGSSIRNLRENDETSIFESREKN